MVIFVVDCQCEHIAYYTLHMHVYCILYMCYNNNNHAAPAATAYKSVDRITTPLLSLSRKLMMVIGRDHRRSFILVHIHRA